MNAALIAQLILQGLQQLQQYQQLLIRAQADGGRDVTNAEIDELGALGHEIRAAARAESERQRAGG